jgi:hypothetical protein
MGKKEQPQAVSSVLVAKGSVSLDKIIEEELLIPDPVDDELFNENTEGNDRKSSTGNN